MNTTEPRFHEVGYQIPRTHDDSPIVPNPAYANMFPAHTKH